MNHFAFFTSLARASIVALAIVAWAAGQAHAQSSLVSFQATAVDGTLVAVGYLDDAGMEIDVLPDLNASVTFRFVMSDGTFTEVDGDVIGLVLMVTGGEVLEPLDTYLMATYGLTHVVVTVEDELTSLPNDPMNDTYRLRMTATVADGTVVARGYVDDGRLEVEVLPGTDATVTLTFVSPDGSIVTVPGVVSGTNVDVLGADGGSLASFVQSTFGIGSVVVEVDDSPSGGIDDDADDDGRDDDMDDDRDDDDRDDDRDDDDRDEDGRDDDMDDDRDDDDRDEDGRDDDMDDDRDDDDRDDDGRDDDMDDDRDGDDRDGSSDDDTDDDTDEDDEAENDDDDESDEDDEDDEDDDDEDDD